MTNDRRDTILASVIVGAILVALVFFPGCGGALSKATAVSNAATVVMVEQRASIDSLSSKDFDAATTPEEVAAATAKWTAIGDAFDALVDAREAALAAIKLAKAAEVAGKEPDVASLLAVTLRLTEALEASRVAWLAVSK